MRSAQDAGGGGAFGAARSEEHRRGKQSAATRESECRARMSWTGFGGAHGCFWLCMPLGVGATAVAHAVSKCTSCCGTMNGDKAAVACRAGGMSRDSGRALALWCAGRPSRALHPFDVELVAFAVRHRRDGGGPSCFSAQAIASTSHAA